jgi:hypothetical protein
MGFFGWVLVGAWSLKPLLAGLIYNFFTSTLAIRCPTKDYITNYIHPKMQFLSIS